MFESEMFGYEPGAFTGAAKRRIGKLEHASGGTLFLDEIESMPLALQVKLLRVLQDGVLERLGSNQPIRVNCRVVAAAKGDMAEHVADGSFRRDLLYRLNVVTIALPPLGERREDIVPLFEHFLLDAAVRYQRPAPILTDRQRESLMQREWPGNVRELRNAADRFVLGVADNPVMSFGDEGAQPQPLKERVEQFERAVIAEALEQSGGAVAIAADRLQLGKATLYEKIKRYGLAAKGDGDRLKKKRRQFMPAFLIVLWVWIGCSERLASLTTRGSVSRRGSRPAQAAFNAFSSSWSSSANCGSPT
jgi:two-component system C4-dicarboxylate transport response regulator DctD